MMNYKRRTDEEWMAIIQECKSSGYSDSEWCKQHNISLSTFYYKLNFLHKIASIAESKPVLQEQQEVVKVSLQDESPLLTPSADNEVALGLTINGISIDILNKATKATIENTLLSLRSLC